MVSDWLTGERGGSTGELAQV